MSLRYKALFVAAASVLAFSSCQQSGPDKETAETADTTTTMPVTLADVPASPEFPGASLTLATVEAVPQGDSALVNFVFQVKNYELKNQTADAGGKQCNNSDKGQHIHFILDNRPYVALYEPKHETKLAKNTEHTLMAFLSRSYHESIKTKGAAIVYHFKVDEHGNMGKLEEVKTPMLFYSRPKGDYLGKDVENVLLDFYVWNDNLSKDGHQVKAEVSSEGKSTSFMISEWKSHFLKNLPMGKSTIKLTLVDKDGNKVEGPETEVSRDINLSKDEPMKP
jgi:hypothetical protein